MSIARKHAYRFGYLKSEQWKTVRLEALAREKGKCQLCDEESVFNDAHHIWYPANIYHTTADLLVILCRPCHDFTHIMVPECKGKDPKEAKDHWLKFFNAIKAWRDQKSRAFEMIEFRCPADLRAAYLALRDKCKEQESALSKNRFSVDSSLLGL